jgi:hypothetical protein
MTVPKPIKCKLNQEEWEALLCLWAVMISALVLCYVGR